MKKDFNSKLNDFLIEQNISKDDLITYLNQQRQIDAEQRLLNKVKEHEDLIGRCFVEIINKNQSMFPTMKRYYKVLSCRSENEYRAECLLFNEYPTYWFKYQAHRIHQPGDFYLGRFEFKSIYVDSIMVHELESMEEITTKEFEEAAHNYINELLKLNFTPDHYRFGGKLPSDPTWPIKVKKDLE